MNHLTHCGCWVAGRGRLPLRRRGVYELPPDPVEAPEEEKPAMPERRVAELHWWGGETREVGMGSGNI